MLRTLRLTNTNCEMKSMAVYRALFAMTNQSAVRLSSSFSTAIWEVENQLDDDHIGSHDMRGMQDICTIVYDSR
jgi:hypothetical protein